MNKIDMLNEQFSKKNLLKVISGLENFDDYKVKNVVTAAVCGNAKAVDIAADANLIEWAASYSTMAIFVSALDVDSLVMASRHGADVLEIGNFDALYTKGQSVTKEQVIAWTRDLYAQVKDQSLICTTIPCLLPMDEQISLATQLQAAGASILQIENLGLGKEDYYFECAKEIVKAVEIPTILSGRLTDKNIIKALKTGVNGVGVGKYISEQSPDKLISTVEDMVNLINQRKLVSTKY